MNVQKEDLGNCQVQLTVTVDDERVQAQMKKSARKLAKELRVPGFRPGKAPYHILVNYVGERAILEEAVEDLLPEVLEEAVTETETQIWRVDDIEPAIDSLEPLVLRFLIPTPPEVELGDVTAIEVPEESPSVEEEAVANVLEELRESRATWVPTVGPAEYGDMITLDLRGELVDGTTVVDLKGFEGVLTEQPKPDGEEETSSEILIPGQEPGKATKTPDLAAQLHGMMVNQVKEFNLAYPEDYPDQKMAGRTVLYRATLLDLKKKVLPELDDELAQSLGEFDDLEALRERIRSNLLAEAEYEAHNRYALAVLDELAEKSEIRYPPAMLKHQVEEFKADLEMRVARLGYTLETYLEEIGKTRDELEDEYTERAERFLRRSLTLTEYISNRGIDVTQEEIDREIELTVAPYGDRASVLRERITSDERALADLVNGLITRKAINKLIAEVSGKPEAPLFPVDEEEEAETVAGEETDESAEPDSKPALEEAGITNREGTPEDEEAEARVVDDAPVAEAEPSGTSENQG